MRIDRHRVEELTSQGWSAREIAQDLGCSQRGVEYVRSRPDVPRESREMLSLDKKFWIEQALDDGCSYEEIGRTVGRSAKTISGRWPGRGWDQVEAGRFRRYTEKLENVINEVWARHLTPAR